MVHRIVQSIEWQQRAGPACRMLMEFGEDGKFCGQRDSARASFHQRDQRCTQLRHPICITSHRCITQYGCARGTDRAALALEVTGQNVSRCGQLSLYRDVISTTGIVALAAMRG